ncbi:MAG: peptidylprolyl isomerase [Chloroflexota bacterium]|nr:peptidylprolyl isomerase [Chloroflexota bacterium]
MIPGATPAVCPTSEPTASEAAVVLVDATTATFETTLGSFTVDLYGDVAPIATANFVALARCGFYESVTFHRVLAGFVAQAGDPNTRDNQGDFEGLGTGGPGYGFAIELPPDGLNYDPYTVAMANAGMANTNGSQFFVCLTDLDAQLPREYTIFGAVSSGMEVVDAIGAVAVNDSLIGVPVDPVVINRIVIGAPESTPD